jgi:hypothetical protein
MHPFALSSCWNRLRRTTYMRFPLPTVRRCFSRELSYRTGIELSWSALSRISTGYWLSFRCIASAAARIQRLFPCAVGPVIRPSRELMPLIMAALERGQPVRLAANGTSMLPFILDGDVVELQATNSAPAIGDVLLVRTSEDHYVIHRVVQIQLTFRTPCPRPLRFFREGRGIFATSSRDSGTG